MSKRSRQTEILRLIEQHDISTQAEMATALQDVGVEAAQATISRDIAELGLLKVRGDERRMIYATEGSKDNDRVRALARALRRWAATIRGSSNIVLIETPAGYASALAQVIDETRHPHVLGTVAGDNTVLVVAAEPVTGAELASELRAMSEPANQLEDSTA
jgi:transcriptional regulator of arginine metabolism